MCDIMAISQVEMTEDETENSEDNEAKEDKSEKCFIVRSKEAPSYVKGFVNLAALQGKL